jgi:hypothetical protein
MDGELIILTDDDFEPEDGKRERNESLNRATGNLPALA